jgi:hypothetical protein
MIREPTIRTKSKSDMMPIHLLQIHGATCGSKLGWYLSPAVLAASEIRSRSYAVKGARPLFLQACKTPTRTPPPPPPPPPGTLPPGSGGHITGQHIVLPASSKNICIVSFRRTGGELAKLRKYSASIRLRGARGKTSKSCQATSGDRGMVCTQVTSRDSVWNETRKVCTVGFRVISLVLAHVLKKNIGVQGSMFRRFKQENQGLEVWGLGDAPYDSTWSLIPEPGS